MKFAFTNKAATQENTDCLILGIFEGQKMTDTGSVVNKATNQYLNKLCKSDEFKGEQGKTMLLHHIPGISASKVLLVGLGKKDDINALSFSKIIKAAFTCLKNTKIKSATCYLTEAHNKNLTETDALRIATMVAQNTLYTFDQYKTKKQTCTLKTINYFIEKPSKADKDAVAQGQAIANGMALAQDLGNEPGNVCVPSYLATKAQSLAKKFTKLTTKIINEAEMKKLGMGALLGVGQGSKQPPKLIVMQYNGGKKTDKPVALVGKGVTFDSGGICIKPGEGMQHMKCDMMGAASVFGVMQTICELKLPINVVGIVPTVENMPDGQAYKPGDILKSMSGQTIEVVNTDAEGRLILCDALTYAAKFKPKTIIDIATLTGAMVVSLGTEVSGIFSNDDTLAKSLVDAGNDVADRAWHMPLVQDYHKQLDSNVADMTNCGSRWGGAITAALFLSNFTKDQKWAHIDNAGTAIGGITGDNAIGRPVPLLVNYLLHEAK